MLPRKSKHKECCFSYFMIFHVISNIGFVTESDQIDLFRLKLILGSTAKASLSQLPMEADTCAMRPSSNRRPPQFPSWWSRCFTTRFLQAFQSLDVDGSGVISVGNLRQASRWSLIAKLGCYDWFDFWVHGGSCSKNPMFAWCQLT